MYMFTQPSDAQRISRVAYRGSYNDFGAGRTMTILGKAPRCSIFQPCAPRVNPHHSEERYLCPFGPQTAATHTQAYNAILKADSKSRRGLIDNSGRWTSPSFISHTIPPSLPPQCRQDIKQGCVVLGHSLLFMASLLSLPICSLDAVDYLFFSCFVRIASVFL